MLQLIIITVLFLTMLFLMGKQEKRNDDVLRIITKQFNFIEKNINERVVYTNDREYSNEERFEDKKAEDHKDEDELEMPHDLTPEELEKQMEVKK